MPTGMQWHDEWTIAPDGKSYRALRQMVSAGTGGGFGGKGGGAAPGGGKGPGGGGAKGKGGATEPELFVKIE
jgi:hypothetical protein